MLPSGADAIEEWMRAIAEPPEVHPSLRARVGRGAAGAGCPTE